MPLVIAYFDRDKCRNCARRLVAIQDSCIDKFVIVKVKCPEGREVDSWGFMTTDHQYCVPINGERC